MPNRTFTKIFKRGSKTYFYNSLFFPKNVKEDVFVLYGFVRKADDFVDAVPQQVDEFYEFKRMYEQAMDGKPSGDLVIDSFVDLSYKHDFPKEWTDAFLHSMELDIVKESYANMDEVDTYIYGSAEVIGLYMARILGLGDHTHHSAQYLGKAMQYINFIRDINEDLDLGRSYFPLHYFEEFGLLDLTPGSAAANPEGFKAFVRKQLEWYDAWQALAEDGFKLIPRRTRIPIKNASEMYKWTANQIRKDPFVVYERKVKPSIPRILGTMLLNTMTSIRGEVKCPEMDEMISLPSSARSCHLS